MREGKWGKLGRENLYRKQVTMMMTKKEKSRDDNVSCMNMKVNTKNNSERIAEF